MLDVNGPQNYEIWTSAHISAMAEAPQSQLVASFRFFQEALDYVYAVNARGASVALRKPDYRGRYNVSVY